MSARNGSSTNRETRLARKTVALREKILAALDSAQMPVTVRQVYYLVASVGGVPKTEGGYRRVQRQLLAMRRELEIPYQWIADNTRWRIKPDTDTSIGAHLARSARFYRQDLWIYSNTYLEIWCEKDAVAGVIHPVTDEYDVPLYVARGYSSETFAYEAALHMRESQKDKCWIFYVGDFDPSGWDASRDLAQRLRGFYPEARFERLAINREQIEEHGLITRPTKLTDTRTKRFFAEFGTGQPSCELEAMHPDTLRRLIREAIERHTNPDQLETLCVQEEAARETLAQFAAFYE